MEKITDLTKEFKYHFIISANLNLKNFLSEQPFSDPCFWKDDTDNFGYLHFSSKALNELDEDTLVYKEGCQFLAIWNGIYKFLEKDVSNLNYFPVRHILESRTNRKLNISDLDVYDDVHLLNQQNFVLSPTCTSSMYELYNHIVASELLRHVFFALSHEISFVSLSIVRDHFRHYAKKKYEIFKNDFQNELNDFGNVANNYANAGVRSRHGGSTKGKSQVKMKLQEAMDLFCEIIRRYITEEVKIEIPDYWGIVSRSIDHNDLFD